MVPLKVVRILKPHRFFKNSIKNYSVKLFCEKNENSSNGFVHPYKKSFTKSELLDYLVENVVYNKDGIVVTNKPYGISKKKKDDPENLRSFIPQTFSDLCLEEIYQDFAFKLGAKMVVPLMIPEKLSSGVSIFATTEEAETNFKMGLQRSKNRSELSYTHLAVTVDKPINDVHEAKFGITFDKTLNIVNKWSKNSVKRNEVEIVLWKHQVLSSSKYGSLVKVQLSNPKWKSLRLYLSTRCYSPVLGDALFSCRVAKLMGVPLPTDLIVKDVPNFNPELLSALKLTEREAKIIPNHIHLRSFTCSLKKFEDFFVSVPPPESFLWTCNQLNLNRLDFIQ